MSAWSYCFVVQRLGFLNNEVFSIAANGTKIKYYNGLDHDGQQVIQLLTRLL